MALFFAAWQAVFLVVPFNPLFISKPNLIAESFVELLASGDLLRELAVSAVPFVYGFGAAVVVGVRSASSWAGACGSAMRSIR